MSEHDVDLARGAYRAYGQTTDFKNYQGLPMPAWEDLGPTIQAAWIAAAAAAAAAATARPGITAKIACQAKEPAGDQVALSFVPDYADGRNKEWAAYTPSLSLQMTVKSEVAERFAAGERFTLTFTPDDHR